MIRRLLVCIVFTAAAMAPHAQDVDREARKAEYVEAVTHGAGLLPWQSQGESEQEKAFRAEMEARKDALLAHSADVEHPVLYKKEDLTRARANASSSDWAAKWVANQVSLADYVVQQPAGWIDAMIPKETPANGYGFTCPNCVGTKSQEAVGHPLSGWNYKDPDVLTCRACGQRYPDPAFPETAKLQMPRMGEHVTYFLNDAERAQPDDRSGKLAWHWVGYPIHVSFTGIIRENKIGFMRGAAQACAFAYAFTDDPAYAVAARDILLRYATCYRHWLYHDYWDTYADCDPLYAAWHDKSLPLEWKRHLSAQAYAKDTLDKAGMLQTYWGAGRVHPSTDSVSGLSSLALTYDLTCTAVDSAGSAIWSAEQRSLVERDLLLEYIMGAEPYVGGPNKAENKNNKSPRIYNAMASIAKCLGIPDMADTALRGYEIVRDESFMYDGFSKESPSYNNMYLGQLLVVPETLQGFEWPAGYKRQGTVDYYASDPLLRLMYRGVLWTELPSGYYLPLSDTHVHTHPSDIIVHMGLRRYPDLFEGTLPLLGASSMSEYAMFNIEEDALKKDTGLALPETYFPAWQTAVLRHGEGPKGATMTMAFNMPGGHRHTDNLTIFYDVGGHSLLGDHGYVGDMPVNRWIHSTYSHNLVIVDDGQQRLGERRPELEFMAGSPMATVVEATTNAYEACSEYRRRVVMVKGPGDATFAVDLFRVAGGHKHAFRIFSEVAASDAENGSLQFDGVTVPEEPPLPEIGASLEHDDIFGLRDVRGAEPQGPWQATWSDTSGAYRLWMMSPANRVEASNGPGQRSLEEPGRRVRYVDTVREGDILQSTFVAVHEPMPGSDQPVITSVHQLDASEAGPRAVALQIDSVFGSYVVLNDFERAAEVDGVQFRGEFAILRRDGERVPQWMTAGAAEFACGDAIVHEAYPRQAVEVHGQDTMSLEAPEGMLLPRFEEGVQAYLRAKVDGYWTGFPIASIEGHTINMKDYPLPPIEAVEIMAVHYHGG